MAKSPANKNYAIIVSHILYFGNRKMQFYGIYCIQKYFKANKVCKMHKKGRLCFVFVVKTQKMKRIGDNT